MNIVKLLKGELIVGFQTDLDFEHKMRSIIEKIYYSHFYYIQSIERFDNKNTKGVHPLDQFFAIDAVIHFKNGTIITCQEKSRRYEQGLKHNDFTFEWYNNPTSKPPKEGEWFHIASQLYFYGFINQTQTEYIRYYLIDLLRFRLWLGERNGEINYHFETFQNKQQNSLGNFIVIPFDQIPKDCILYSKET
jgi:hypothetical protein